MNNLVKHVQQLREEAECLVETGEILELDEARSSCSIDERTNCLNCGGANWIETIRNKAGEWIGKPLVVLSLFDGIGGVWAALDNLGIPFIGYSCEVRVEAIEVTKRNYSMVRHLGDIQKLKKGDIQEKVDLVVGGFPCQDLSSMGSRLGLHGSRSRLFFDMLGVIKTFNPTWFLAENVASMNWVNREEISRHLRTTPIEIDSDVFTPCKRRRLYWSNIPYPKVSPRIKESEETSIQSIVKNGVALARKNTCVLTSNGQGTGTTMEQVFDLHKKKIRYIDVVEVELMMGYPANYTKVDGHNKGSWTAKAGPFRSARWCLLGNTFSVPVISYILSPLLDSNTRAQTKKFHLPTSVREQDCSVMFPGEIWAMYNSEQRPNWYAEVFSRSGERFDGRGYEPGMKGSRKPLVIEVRFLELTKSYETGEGDLWCAVRGSGVYHLTPKICVERSWIAFSHRVTSMIKLDDNRFFIYPGKDEVWSVYDSNTESRYLVYVLASSVNKQFVKKGISGKEGFSARCRLLQKKRELDLYTIVGKELVFDDLGVFCFRAPYHFHGERDTLKVEQSVKHRDRGAHSDKLSRKRSRINPDSDNEDFFDSGI